MSSTGDTSAPAGRGVRVALTRAGTPFGTALAELLVAGGADLVGLDERVGDSPGVEWRSVDAGSPAVLQHLEGVDVLVHLAWEPDLQTSLAEQPAVRRARQVRTVRTLLTASAAAGVRRLVVVTSGMIHGARADNPVPLPEDSPARTPDTEGLVADLVAVEQELTARGAPRPGPQVTVLRPGALVGPGVDTMITRHFEAPRLLTLRGTRPAWSFCHVDDLASALLVLARADEVPDELAVSSWGSLSQQDVEELSGMRHVELSESSAHSAADRLHRLGAVPVAASDLAYVAHPWVTEPHRLAALGWQPAHDNASCLATLLDQVRGHRAVMARRLRSRDAVGAAAGAASAAVAVIATAALLRRRRGRD
ncbi:NAD-dependent epimerase/dehydratase family protein [Ornithinimicrobium tianjinense]|uniref:NAD-dependent dehydratase n=1 Tax=Ornithinimicrobium tianjinense TaxID=1195761 RepID=A0A917BV84_9MICO|nr:NAD-dependent epimerase/dehydratase family protein [Ornithinimicrobium tianjinense]GGF59905.1 NAD-dependent dehydratase [Ornithinimicrobium tianjinense]